MTETKTVGLLEWGATMRMARSASSQASEDMRRRKVIKDPLASSILLYTDDPTTAGWFLNEPDMASICNASAIEGVVIVMGEQFPPASFEAVRTDPELPRVAAMWFPAPGLKCPRCRNFTRPSESDVCAICETQTRARAHPETNDG